MGLDLHVLLVEAALKAVEALKQIGKERQEFLVEQVVTAAADGSKEGPQEQEIVVGLFGAEGQFHRFVDDLRQVRFEHLFVFGGKERHAAKDQFEQFQVEIGAFHVRAHLFHVIQKVLHLFIFKTTFSQSIIITNHL